MKRLGRVKIICGKIKRISEEESSRGIFKSIFLAGMKGWFLDCLMTVFHLFRLYSVECVDLLSEPGWA
jgi:hypothetical protein